MTLLDRAEAIDPKPSSALFETRARFLAALGEADRASADRREPRRTPRRPRRRDFYLRGTSRAANGQHDAAEADLGRAVALDPRRFWAWFVLGLCHADEGRYADAVGDFNACTLLAPEFAWPHLNRGLALARSGRLAEARGLLRSRPGTEPRLRRGPRRSRPRPASSWTTPRRPSATCRTPFASAAATPAPWRPGPRPSPGWAAATEAERAFADALAVRPDDPRTLVARGFSRLEADPKGASSRLPQGPRPRPPPRSRPLRHGPPAAARTSPRRPWTTPARPSTPTPRRGTPCGSAPCSSAARATPPPRPTPIGCRASPSAQNLYNAACALALLDAANGKTDHRDLAREYLRRALELGFPREHADADPDLATLRPSR